MNSNTKFVWADVETNGLDHDDEEIIVLELGLVVTDDQLTEIDSRSWPIIPYVRGMHGDASDRDRWELFLNRVEESCPIHGHSGLISEIKNSGFVYYEAYEQALSFMGKHCFSMSPPMCGASPQFDRAFLRRDFRRVHDLFHYRNVDISSIVGLVKEWMPGIEGPFMTTKHRALDDIRDAIARLKFYKERIFDAVAPSQASAYAKIGRFVIEPVVDFNDAWVGLYANRRRHRLYAFPIPFVGAMIHAGGHPWLPECSVLETMASGAREAATSAAAALGLVPRR